MDGKSDSEAIRDDRWFILSAFDEMKRKLGEAGERAKDLATNLPVDEIKGKAREAGEGVRQAGKTLINELGESSSSKTDKGSSRDVGQESRKTDAASSASGVKAEGSDNSQAPKNPKPISRQMIAGVIALIVVVATIVLSVVLGSSGGGKTEEAEDVQFFLEITGKENLIFSRYDVEVALDDEVLGVLEHGGYFSQRVTLSSGNHTVSLTKTDDSSVDGELSINVTPDEQAPMYEASCYSDRVEIAELTESEANKRRADRFSSIANQPGEKATDIVGQLEDAGYAEAGFTLMLVDGESEVPEDRLNDYLVASAEASADELSITLHLQSGAAALTEDLEAIANQPGVSADKVISQLERAGYRAAGYSLLCFDGEEELSDFEPSDYGVVEGSVDSDGKTIILQLEYTKPIEPSVSQDMARRAAVVAMTNCFATDVLTADGSSYDASKFHSYSDMSGYYMTVEQDGSWSGKDENTWTVADLALKVAGGDLYVVVSGDITFDGSNYVLPSVEVKYGNSLDDAMAGGGWSGATETHAVGESSPYLTVPSSLVENDRDSEAEDKARQEEADKKNAEREYDSWVDSHFSFWNGQCDELVDLVVERLNDEKSFDHKETSYIAVRDEATLQEVNQILESNASDANIAVGDVVVVMEFTAKNGFNATIKNSAMGVIRYPSGAVELLAIV